VLILKDFKSFRISSYRLEVHQAVSHWILAPAGGTGAILGSRGSVQMAGASKSAVQGSAGSGS
jgi:hypothetical protein